MHMLTYIKYLDILIKHLLVTTNCFKLNLNTQNLNLTQYIGII